MLIGRADWPVLIGRRRAVRLNGQRGRLVDIIFVDSESSENCRIMRKVGVHNAKGYLGT